MIWKLRDIPQEMRCQGENYEGPLCLDVLSDLQSLFENVEVSLAEFPITGQRMTLKHAHDLFYWGASRSMTLSQSHIPGSLGSSKMSHGASFCLYKRTWLTLGSKQRSKVEADQFHAGASRRGVWSWLLVTHEPIPESLKVKVLHLLQLKEPQYPEITLYPGPDFHMGLQSIKKWRVHPDSNGMGIRLSSVYMDSSLPYCKSIDSCPVFSGIVQWTPQGPIILGPRCQSHGGYPRIFWISPSEMARVIQYRPGEWMRWRILDRDDLIEDDL